MSPPLLGVQVLQSSSWPTWLKYLGPQVPTGGWGGFQHLPPPPQTSSQSKFFHSFSACEGLNVIWNKLENRN